MNKTTTALLALVCAAIGLASSYVTGQFFIIGLEKLESDFSLKNGVKNEHKSTS